MQPSEHSEPQWNGAPFSPPPGQPGQFSPPPGVQPPQPPKKRNKGCMIAGIVAGSLVLLLATCAIIGSFLPSPPVSSNAPQGNQSSRAATKQPTMPPKAMATVPPTPTTVPTKAPTPTPQPSPTPTKAANTGTHGKPHLGGPISDYYGAYGTPNNQGIGNSETWVVDKDQTFVNATPDSANKVTAMNVTGPDTWTREQTEAYCGKFLPADAAEFNRLKDTISTLIDYHSSAGEVVMTVMDGGACLLNFGQG